MIVLSNKNSFCQRIKKSYESFRFRSGYTFLFSPVAFDYGTSINTYSIWVQQVHYRDSKERDEFMAMCGKDEKITQLYKQCMDLITPGSTIMGEFKRLEV